MFTPWAANTRLGTGCGNGPWCACTPHTHTQHSHTPHTHSTACTHTKHTVCTHKTHTHPPHIHIHTSHTHPCTTHPPNAHTHTCTLCTYTGAPRCTHTHTATQRRTHTVTRTHSHTSTHAYCHTHTHAQPLRAPPRTCLSLGNLRARARAAPRTAACTRARARPLHTYTARAPLARSLLSHASRARGSPRCSPARRLRGAAGAAGTGGGSGVFPPPGGAGRCGGGSGGLRPQHNKGPARPSRPRPGPATALGAPGERGPGAAAPGWAVIATLGAGTGGARLCSPHSSWVGTGPREVMLVCPELFQPQHAEGLPAPWGYWGA